MVDFRCIDSGSTGGRKHPLGIHRRHRRRTLFAYRLRADVMPLGGSVAGFRVIVAAVIDSDATAWSNQVTTNGGTVSSTRLGLISDLISGLKTDGIWTKLDRQWIYAAEDQPGALTDLVGLTLATAV